MCPDKSGKVETGINNRGQDRTVFGEKCKLSFQFRGSLARSPGARLEPLGHLSLGRQVAAGIELSLLYGRAQARGEWVRLVDIFSMRMEYYHSNA